MPRKIYKKKCKSCDKKFETHSATRLYCTNTCRNKHNVNKSRRKSSNQRTILMASWDKVINMLEVGDDVDDILKYMNDTIEEIL